MNSLKLSSIYDTKWPTVQQILDLKKRFILCFGNVTVNGYSAATDQSYIFPASSEICLNNPILTSNNSWLFTNDPSLAIAGHPAPNIYMVGTGYDTNRTDLSPGATLTNLTSQDYKLSWRFAKMYETMKFDSDKIKGSVLNGFSPVFNQTDIDKTLNLLVWSWREGFPTNETGRDCGQMNVDDGRWTNVPCQNSLVTSCQNAQDPLDWTIATTRTLFSGAEKYCESPYVFSVPKTPLENYALYQQLISSNVSYSWINLNQQMRQYCWVSGTNTTCPYSAASDVLPAVIEANLKSGLVLLIVIAIFLYFKISRQIKVYKANRRRAEVRRKIRLLDINCIPI